MTRRFSGMTATALVAVLALFWQTGCAPHAARPGRQVVTIFASRWAGPERLAEEAAVVKHARSLGPCIWFVLGEVLSDSMWTQLADGTAQAALLDAAGADAIVLGPEWLGLGPERLRRVLDRSRFYSLGANILDSLAVPIGHPFLLKTLPGATLAFCAVWSDSADPRLRQRGVRKTDPDFAVRKLLPLLRNRADLVLVAVNPNTSVPKWDVDGIIGTRREDMISVVPAEQGLACLTLFVRDGRLVDYSLSEVRREPGSRDFLSGVVLDSLQRVLDSLSGKTVVIKAGMTTEAATREIARSAVEACADGFLLDGSLVRGSLKYGDLTVGGLIGALAEPGRLLVFELTGKELRGLLGKGASLEWRSGLRGKQPAAERRYRVCATPGLVSRRQELAGREYQLTGERLWQMAVRSLEGGKP